MGVVLPTRTDIGNSLQLVGDFLASCLNFPKCPKRLEPLTGYCLLKHWRKSRAKCFNIPYVVHCAESTSLSLMKRNKACSSSPNTWILRPHSLNKQCAARVWKPIIEDTHVSMESFHLTAMNKSDTAWIPLWPRQSTPTMLWGTGQRTD